MKYSVLPLLAAAALSPLSAASPMQCDAVSGERRVALLELYTSEGCDSCPPTDRWASELPVRGYGLERLVVLGLHVDYWNHLGWPDPFAQKNFTARQRAGSVRNDARFVYTPQLLLDGKDVRPGPARDAIGERIAAVNQRAPGAMLTLRLRAETRDRLTASGTVDIRDRTAGASAGTYLALYENHLASRVIAGENRGKYLQHDFVVRELAGPFATVAGKITNFSHDFRLDRTWKPKDLHVAVFVQNETSGEVLQAMALPHCGG